MNFKFSNTVFDSIYFLGDIHGDYHTVSYYLNRFNIKNSLIIQVGDFGIGAVPSKDREILPILNDFLIEHNCILAAIRGNHDNPAKFNNTYVNSNILLIKDYTVLEVLTKSNIERILCIGGAISIDRKKLIAVKGFWFKEEPVDFSKEIKEDKITILVTHTAPDSIEPYVMGNIVYHFAAKDETLMDEILEERRLMTKMFDKILESNKNTLKEHYYGHFHFSAITFKNGIKHKLLDVCELA